MALSLAITISMGQIAIAGEVPEKPAQRAFVDWPYAVEIWKTHKSGEEFDQEYDRVVPAYEAWLKNPGAHDIAALSALGDDAQSNKIRQGADLRRVYAIWQDIYRYWYSGRSNSKHQPAAWNQNSRGCPIIQEMNIFTGDCNDIPDWRTSKDVARDDQVLAEYLARKAKTN